MDDETTEMADKTTDEALDSQHRDRRSRADRPQGHIRDMGMLDLRSAKTVDDIRGISGISDVGVILIPEHLAAALAQIPINDVGTIVPVPIGDDINVLTGQVRLTGEALAGGDSTRTLLIVGQAFISTPVVSVGYKEIQVFGQIFAPRGSETALGAKLSQLNGQIFYLPTEPRILMGATNIGKAYLELLPTPEALVIMGELTIESDVTVELLRSMVPEIVLMGHISAPAALVPLLHVLTREKMGEITASGA